MTEPLSRDDVIELLKKLGSDSDEEVLEAARETHARIAAAGMTWEELLVPEGGVAESDADADESDDADDDDEADEAEFADPEDETAEDETAEDETAEDETAEDETAEDETAEAGVASAKHADSMALIDKLLAKSGISADMREELKGYKTDIAEGDFAARDRRYISAIYKRLSKRR